MSCPGRQPAGRVASRRSSPRLIDTARTRTTVSLAEAEVSATSRSSSGADPFPVATNARMDPKDTEPSSAWRPCLAFDALGALADAVYIDQDGDAFFVW